MTQSSYSIEPYIDTASKFVNGELDPTAYNELIKKNGWQHKVVTPDMIPDDIKQIYAKQGEAALNPWYQNEMAVGQAGLDAETAKTSTDYQRTIEDLNRGLQEDTATLADTEGTKGTWGSSARAERLSSLASKYGSKFGQAFSGAQNALDTTSRAGEYKYGNVPVTNTSLQQYGVSESGAVNPTSTFRYNPFGGQGALNVQKKALGAQLGGDYLKARIKSPTL